MRAHDVRIATLLACLLFAGAAGAHPGITGYSGKPYNGMSETCTTNCHAKGANPPTLTITVPATVEAGSTSSVTIAVAGNRVRTSMNAAFSDGVKTIKGQNTDTPLPAQEPTEIGAVVPPPSGAAATYKFSFIAPKTPGSITMYVAGMAASGNGTNGDAVTNTTRTITVTAADAGTTGTTDAGSSSGGSDASASGGTSGTSGTSGGGTLRDGGAAGGASSSGASSSGTTASDDGDSGGGCSLAPTIGGPRQRSTTITTTTVLAGTLSLALALVAISRRRRSS